MLPNQTLSDRQLRWFGLSLSALILTLGLLISWRWQIAQIGWAAGILAATLAAVFYLVPSTRRPIHRGFTCCVYPIQLVVTAVLLAIVYFAVVTPIGICLRITGHDPLQRWSGKQDKETSATYWTKRAAAPEDKQYFKMY